MRNGVQPSPHIPDPSERLMLAYTTGDDSGLSDPDDGLAFAGMIDESAQREARVAEGVQFEGGEVYQELLTAAEAELAELAAEGAGEEL